MGDVSSADRTAPTHKNASFVRCRRLSSACRAAFKCVDEFCFLPSTTQTANDDAKNEIAWSDVEVFFRSTLLAVLWLDEESFLAGTREGALFLCREWNHHEVQVGDSADRSRRRTLFFFKKMTSSASTLEFLLASIPWDGTSLYLRRRMGEFDVSNACFRKLLEAAGGVRAAPQNLLKFHRFAFTATQTALLFRAATSSPLRIILHECRFHEPTLLDVAQNAPPSSRHGPCRQFDGRANLVVSDTRWESLSIPSLVALLRYCQLRKLIVRNLVVNDASLNDTILPALRSRRSRLEQLNLEFGDGCRLNEASWEALWGTIGGMPRLFSIYLNARRLEERFKDAPIVAAIQRSPRLEYVLLEGGRHENGKKWEVATMPCMLRRQMIRKTDELLCQEGAENGQALLVQALISVVASTDPFDFQTRVLDHCDGRFKTRAYETAKLEWTCILVERLALGGYLEPWWNNFT